MLDCAHNNLHKIYKKLTLYIVRVSYNGNIHGSAPCKDCTKTMNSLGIKRIVYSTDTGDLVSCKMCDYVPITSSLGRRYIESDFKLGKKQKSKQKSEPKSESSSDSESESSSESK